MVDEQLLRKLLEGGFYGAYHLLRSGVARGHIRFTQLPPPRARAVPSAPQSRVVSSAPQIRPVSLASQDEVVPPMPEVEVAPPAPRAEAASPEPEPEPEPEPQPSEGVSVIVPYRGRADTLLDAVRSVFQQEHAGGLEIIVVDDASPGGVPNLPELANAEVRILRHDEQRGPGAARNTGIRESAYDWILPLDEDDYLPDHALAGLASIARRGHKLVYGDIWTLDIAGLKLVKLPPYDFSLLLETCFMHNTSMFAKEAWRLAGGYDESLPGLEDWEFWIRLGSIGICGEKIQRPVVVYRLSKDGRSRSFDRHAVRETIKAKHAGLFRGERPLSCCGKKMRKGRKVVPQMTTNTQFGAAGLEELEYVGAMDSYNHHGPATGASYTFTKALPVRFVDRRDAAMMLNEAIFIRPGQPKPQLKTDAPDVHALAPEPVLVGIPLEDIKGISKRRAGILAEAGITSCEGLAAANAENVAKLLKVSKRTVVGWQIQARMKIKELKNAS